jgi:hypothetical protein
MNIKKALVKIPGARRIYSLYRHLESFPCPEKNESLSQQCQKILINQYTMARLNDVKLHPRIADAGFRCYSQFEEDGIILYVLSTIGFRTKKVVEICCGDGRECMATNLVLNHGFRGFLFDGNENNIMSAARFFGGKKDCLLTPPYLKKAWITRENVNDLLTESGAAGEIDLLSLDIDGNDYHIWDAISAINPRLCVFETQDIIPDNVSITIPYDPDFDCWEKNESEQDFRSVSLLAMKKLSEKKGYRLIGAHRHGFNVFFLRQDIAPDIFPEVTIEEVHNNEWTQKGQKERWDQVKNMNWIEV